MRYLKTFNENSNESIIGSMRDILLDLEDEGFKIDLQYQNEDNINRLYIMIRKIESRDISGGYNLKRFKFSEISNTIRQLIEYTSGSEWRYNRFSYDNDKNTQVFMFIPNTWKNNCEESANMCNFIMEFIKV